MAVSKRLRYEILRRDNHACRYCGAAAPDVKLNVDHVIPTSLGGSDKPDNLVTACAECNSGKTSSMPNAEPVADVDQETFRQAAEMKDRRPATFVHLVMTWAWSWERSTGNPPGEADRRDFAEDLNELLDRGLSAQLDLTNVAFEAGRDLASDPASYLPEEYLTAEERADRMPPTSEEADLGGSTYVAWWSGWDKDWFAGRGSQSSGPSARQDRIFRRQLMQAIKAGHSRDELRSGAHIAGVNRSPELAAHLPERCTGGGDV